MFKTMPSNENAMTPARGRPGDVPEATIKKIRQLRARGWSYGKIATKLDVPRSTVRYHASHQMVREERRKLWAKTHQRVRVIHCTECGGDDHNAATCKKAA